MKCKHCYSEKTNKRGVEVMATGKRIQKYKCMACGKNFYGDEIK